MHEEGGVFVRGNDCHDIFILILTVGVQDRDGGRQPVRGIASALINSILFQQVDLRAQTLEVDLACAGGIDSDGLNGNNC